MKIFCRNYSCKYIRFLETPIRFSYRKYYIPLGEDDGYCIGECQKEFPGFNLSIIETPQVKHKLAECALGELANCSTDCLWCQNGKCTKDEIIVDKIKIRDNEYWVCKCRSDINISGHIDFSRFGRRKDML